MKIQPITARISDLSVSFHNAIGHHSNPTISSQQNFSQLSGRKESFPIYTFGAKETKMKIHNVVKMRLKDRDDPNLCFHIEAVETKHILTIHLPTPYKNKDKKFKHLKNVQLADCYEFNNKEISNLLGVDYYYEINVQQVLATCEKSALIFKDASMDLRKWRTNSLELRQELKKLNFEVDEFEESQNTKLIASKILEVDSF
ncbi:DUF1758 domain-containing protein [Nephila pilipes]|uniref:DUF1758 domain-containing protein n=1 Tax=Nephila pilipes TaxID=299642 RepID=A0A8X6PWI2_NEPPI|nr:DUF1758 domain-containing protein [Nephila pilipes]